MPPAALPIVLASTLAAAQPAPAGGAVRTGVPVLVDGCPTQFVMTYAVRFRLR